MRLLVVLFYVNELGSSFDPIGEEQGVLHLSFGHLKLSKFKSSMRQLSIVEVSVKILNEK